MAESILAESKSPQDAADAAVQSLKQFMLGDTKSRNDFQALWNKWSGNGDFLKRFGDQYRAAIKGDARIAPLLTTFAAYTKKKTADLDALVAAFAECNEFIDKGLPNFRVMEKKYDVFFIEFLAYRTYEAAKRYIATGAGDDYGRLKKFRDIYGSDKRFSGSFEARAEELRADPALAQAAARFQEKDDARVDAYNKNLSKGEKPLQKAAVGMASFMDASIDTRDALDTGDAERVKRKYGSAFVEEFSTMKKGASAAAAAAALADFADSADASRLTAFKEAWHKEIQKFKPAELSERQAAFIASLQSELSKRAPALQEAADALAKKQGMRYVDYGAFCDSVAGALADLRKQGPDALKWMADKYSAPMLSYLASKLEGERAKKAVSYLEHVLEDPKDNVHTFQFVRSWQMAGAAFAVAFHDEVSSSAKLAGMVSEYEKRFGQLRDEKSAAAFCRAVESVYDDLKSSSPQPARFHPKYGAEFVNAISSSISFVLPKKVYTQEQTNEKLDSAQRDLEALESYFKAKGMNMDPRVRVHLDEWSERLQVLRQRGSSYAEADVLFRNIPTAETMELVVRSADMDVRTLVRIYNGKDPKTGNPLSYAYSITDGWIARMEALLVSMDSTKAMRDLGWLYTTRLQASGFDIQEIRTNVANLKATLAYVRTVYLNLSSTDLMKSQMDALKKNIDGLTMPVSSDFKATLSQAISQTAVKIDALGAENVTGAKGAAEFWASQIRLIDDVLGKLKPEFRDRLAIQLYSDWHEEESNKKGYSSFPAALLKITGDSAFLVDRSFLLSELKAKTIEYQFSQKVPGQQQPLQPTVSMNAGGEVYDAFNSLSLETQYELLRQFRQINPAIAAWDNTTWARFGATVLGLRNIPGSHAALLLKRISGDTQVPVDEAAPSKGKHRSWGLLSYDPNSIAAILGVISGYSSVFYPGGHYRELGSYYNSLPGKLNKLFTDIFTLKDEVKEEYTDVRIIKPTEQSQYAELFIPAARIVVQIPKHVYETVVSAQLILEMRQAAPVTDSSQAVPDILRTERRFFVEKAIEGRLMLPIPAVLPLLAMNKAYLLAPSYIPEVGEWYGVQASELAATAWERQKSGATSNDVWQMTSSTSATLVGEGKSAQGTYTLQRGTGTTSTDEGTATFTNLSFNELRVSDALIEDLREFRKKSPEQQAAAWKAQAARLAQKFRAAEEPAKEPIEARSEEAGKAAAILGQVSAIRLSEVMERGKPTGEYEASVLSERGEITHFKTNTADIASKQFSSDFWDAIRGMRSSDLTLLRTRRMGALADAVNSFMDAEKSGAHVLDDPEAAKLSTARLSALQSQVVRDILGAVDSLYIEQVTRGGKPMQSYTVEVRIGTTALFSFTTASGDPASEQFRHDFWRSFTDQNVGEMRGRLKDRGMEAFASALETFNLMSEASQVAVLSDRLLADASSDQFRRAAIFAGKPKEGASAEELAGRILDGVAVKKVKENEYEVSMGSGVAIGSVTSDTEAQAGRDVEHMLSQADPDEIRDRALRGTLLPGSVQRELFGAGRNAVSGNVYVKHEDDKYTRITTAVNAIAPGGADTAVYFNREYQGTQGTDTMNSITDKTERFVAGATPAQVSGKSEDDIANMLGLSDSEKQALKDKGIKPSQVVGAAFTDWSANPAPGNQMGGTKKLLGRLVNENYLYQAYVFKRLENGSFVLMDLKTYTPSDAAQLYQQTVAADADLAYRLYGREHPMMGRAGEGELEHCVIFAGDKTTEQGYGAAYQKKKWGGYGLLERTRGGRATAGIGYMDPENRAYYVGRLYVSDINQKDVYNTRTQTTETERGYYAQFTMLQSQRFRADAFAGKQSRWEAGTIFDYLGDRFYAGGGFLKSQYLMGANSGNTYAGRFYLMDPNLINAAVVSGLAQAGKWQDFSAGGRFVLHQLGMEVKGGVMADRDTGKGGFLRVEYRPDNPLWGFKSWAGSGFFVTGEREVKIAGVELGGPRRELDAYWSAGGGGAGELKLHYQHLDITAGGAGNVEGLVKYAGWGGVRLRLDPATVFLVGSVGKEITPTQTTDSTTGAIIKGETLVKSGEWMLGSRLRLTPPKDTGRTWSAIAAVSGIEQAKDDLWGRQYNLQLGALRTSFYDDFRGTIGYQYWENKQFEQQAATLLMSYNTRLAKWVFRDVTWNISSALGKQVTKESGWEQLFVNVMFSLQGTFY